MKNNLNIFLIENQFTQFYKIKNILKNERHEVHPNDAISFKTLIDKVRVFLNPRYGGLQSGSLRANAYEFIVNHIMDNSYDILIIDYILVGCHIGKNGIFLAENLRRSEINAPIVFISRESRNEYEISRALHEGLEPYTWCYKGYAGKEISKEEYFKEHVISKFMPLLGESEFSSYFDKINYILNLNIFNRDPNNRKQVVHLHLYKILENRIINEKEKIIIDNFLGKNDHNELDRSEFVDELTKAVILENQNSNK